MLMKKLTVILMASLAILCWSCSDEPSPEITPEEEEIEIPENYKGTMYGLSISMTESQKAANKSVNDFSLFLVKGLNENFPKDQGFVFSPVTETMISLMIANSADKEYQKRLLELMGCDNLDKLNRFAGQLVDALPNKDKGSNLVMANSLWLNGNNRLSDSYSEILKDVFDVESTSLDFGDEKSASIINEWSRRVTMGIIDQVITSDWLIGASFLWASSIYFHGDWAIAFDEKLTTNDKFQTPTETITIPMMHQRDVRGARYAESENYQYVAIPTYGNVRFQVILPPEDKALTNAIADMPEDISALIIHQATYETESAIQDHIHISMPRFACKSSIDFSGLYDQLGLIATSYPGLNYYDGYPIRSIQTASVTADEYGISVAATSVSHGVDSGYSPEAKEYNVVIDRPFFFFLSDKFTGTILFAGLITNP